MLQNFITSPQGDILVVNRSRVGACFKKNIATLLRFMLIMQVLEAAWCLTNIAAGTPEQTKALLPTLPLLIAHLGG